MKVVNVDDAQWEVWEDGRWGHAFKVLTPSNRETGSLGVSQNRLRPGFASAPFHWHAREDEVFFIQSGRAVWRYGDSLREVRAGDCLSAPAGTQIAHQLCNPFEEDCIYLAMGPHDPHEVCGYPDSGKVMVRAIGTVGHLEKTPYMEGEPDVPRIFDLLET